MCVHYVVSTSNNTWVTTIKKSAPQTFPSPPTRDKNTFPLLVAHFCNEAGLLGLVSEAAASRWVLKGNPYHDSFSKWKSKDAQQGGLSAKVDGGFRGHGWSKRKRSETTATANGRKELLGSWASWSAAALRRCFCHAPITSMQGVNGVVWGFG